MTTAIYVRVSSANQNFAMQKSELLEYARMRKWGETKIYEDKASGANVTRPGLELLLRDARAGKVKRLLAYKLDRLGRSLPHLALILSDLHQLGIALICPGQGIDTSDSNPAGALQRNILMAVAEFERALIGERTRDGLAEARRKGVRLGRPGVKDEVKKQGQGLKSLWLGLPRHRRASGHWLGDGTPPSHSLIWPKH